MTHAFFKAVLFLGAGSVIIAMQHEHDMRKMGVLRKYMPITYWTVLVGALANAGIPPFAGFFSKETIVEAAHLSTTPGAQFAYVLAVAGVFISALYSFRLVFYAFHGKERFDASHGHTDHTLNHGDHGDHGVHKDEHHGDGHGHHAGPPKESPWVVTLPLILLAIPSVLIGALTIGPMLYGDWFNGSIARTATMAALAREFHGALGMITHAFTTLPFWLAIA